MEIENNENDISEYNLTPLKTRTPRRQFTPCFRADVIRRVESGESVTKVSQELKLDRSNVYRWIENKSVLLLNENQNTPRIKLNPKGCRFVLLEAELDKYVAVKRKGHKSVSKEDVQKEALRLSVKQ